jgi:hypothetical protein
MLSADTQSDQVVSDKVVICVLGTSHCCHDCSKLDCTQVRARLHFFTATNVAAVCDIYSPELAEALIEVFGDGSAPDASTLVESLPEGLARRIQLDATTGRIIGVST